jgi:hypothetical protein
MLLEFDKLGYTKLIFTVITFIYYCKLIIYEVKNTADLIDIIIMLPAAAR